MSVSFLFCSIGVHAHASSRNSCRALLRLCLPHYHHALACHCLVAQVALQDHTNGCIPSCTETFVHGRTKGSWGKGKHLTFRHTLAPTAPLLLPAGFLSRRMVGAPHLKAGVHGAVQQLGVPSGWHGC